VSTVAEPRLLLLETSGRVGQVALAQGDRLLGERRLDETRRHARDLAPAVAGLLAAQGWRPRELHGVIVSRGPGSYTGLRVGIISAKALAYVTGCGLVAVDTFAVIAAQAPAEVDRLDVLADAQQDKVYVQRFVRPPDGGDLLPDAPLQIEALPDWLGRVSTETASWVSGPALRLHQGRLPSVCQPVDAALWDPTPANLLRLGLARYRAGTQESVWSLEPLYLRPSSAEEKLRNRAP
jgi:tRNA threonylcarbamoyladenosine biosynthesis protein TsaB